MNRSFSPTSRVFWQRLIVLTMCIVVFGACRGDESKTVDEDVVPVQVSPGNLNEVPEGVEEVSISISGGAIELESVTLQQNEPTILHIDNQDQAAYSIQIVPNLVTPTTVGASSITDVSFTTPNANRYTLELRVADGTGAPLDTVDVLVQSPGGDV